MNREKILKKKTTNNIKKNKMSDINNIMNFKDFKGHSNFQVQLNPFTKSTKNEIEQMIQSSKSENKYYFEWTTYQSKVKPFYDIDMYYDNKEEQEKNIDIIKNETLELLKGLYPESDIAISSSHGAKTKIKTIQKVKQEIKGFAISFHFIVCDYETTVKELKEFNNKNNLYDIKFKNTNEKMFDNSVYRDGGNMRFIYSYKPNDVRQKIPVNYKDDDTITKHIIQSTDDTNSFKYPLPTIISPPTSPPQSPKSKEDKIDAEPINNYDVGELQSIINILPNECYEYELWVRIGMAICNITNGDNIGKGMYIDWSKKDKENYDFSVINGNWKRWIKPTGNKLGMTFLRKLKSKYQPQRNKTLKEIFFEAINCEKNYIEAKESMLKELNNRLIFIRSSGEYIILDKKIITKYQRDDITIDEQFNIPSWYCKNATKTKDHFLNEKFSYTFDVNNGNEDGDKKTIKIDPFKMWCEWKGKRNVFEIGFDPRNRENNEIFNLWNGYNIGKEDTEKYDEAEAKPLLDHIKNIWCKGSEESYEYIMNYFAHILQKPYEKTGVVLALKSEQGGGKGIVLKKLGNIIGDTHYAQNSNANFLFGDFNGQLEGKILINLDEAFWGGDKKMEGVIKNKVTETKQTINKKNKENYVIDCHANYIITTNNDWFAGTTEDDRRHYCLELDNAKAGRTTKESEEYFSEIENVSCESFAKILYNRDISNFKARMFKKTKLLQDQVERNWNSPKVWWNSIMKKGGFQYGEHFVEWNKVLEVECEQNIINYGLKIKNKKKEKKVVYEKEWLFNCYDKQTYNSRKFDNSSFWREMEKHCICDLYQENRIQINKQRRMFIFLPSLEDARKKWNEKQQYDYNYDVDEEDEWDVDDCDIDSSDDE
tara:strand:- start:53 stop:2692 length:2640 start_codon:yes stop_codon:yes gene_type:complete